MYKANSLHQIIPSQSFGSNPYLPVSQVSKNTFTLIQDNENHLQRKYEISMTEYNRQSHLFEWRKKIHHPIPKITQIKPYTDVNQRNMATIYCEHINMSFTDLRILKIQQIMYCLSQMLLGYQQICARLGFVCIQSKLIGLNIKGQILIWINQNLLTFNGSQNKKLSTEKQIVLKIIQLLQTKAHDKNHIFFAELRKLDPKFKNILDFIMSFKNKHKLKIIPRIIVENNIKSISQKMIVSNTFSNKTDQPLQSKPFFNDQSSIMKTSTQIKNSQSQSQFLAGSKVNSNQCSIIRNNVSNRTSIIQPYLNNTPTNNMASSIYEKAQQKINFSYSQKRPQISTPKQSTFIRDYTSDKNLPLLTKIRSETNQIKQFTLDDKKSNIQKSQKAVKRSKFDKKIVHTYTLSYTPLNDTIYLQTQLDMKKSKASHYSQSSFTSKDKFFGQDMCQNKTSMTTNHRSAVTQSFQSGGKSSNDDEYYTRKNDLFISNNSHRTTYSIIKSSVVENEPGKNAVSFVLGTNHDYHPSSPLNHTFISANNQQNSEKRKQMYTFGGLMTPLLQQNHQVKHSSTMNEHHSIPFSHLYSVPLIQKSALANQINTKSIDQLYNNLYFNSQKKSLIMDQNLYQVKLSPVKQEVHSHVKESFVIDLSQTKGHQPLSHVKPPSDRVFHEFLTPKMGAGEQYAFDYNQWRGIKGLLNESNVYELKQSIHCGPDIRTPLNIKLDLLDKFGRQIGQSILPGTPSAGHHSRTHSVYTMNADEHSVEYY